MLKQRTLLLAGVLFMLAVGIGFFLSAPAQPESNGKGKDSLGTGFYGFKGIYATMGALGLSVRRSYVPPSYKTEGVDTVALLSPSRVIAHMDPEFIRKLRGWATGGGRVVLALKRQLDGHVAQKHVKGYRGANVAGLLGFGSLRVQRYRTAQHRAQSVQARQKNPGRYMQEYEKNEYVYREYEHPVNARLGADGTLAWITEGCEMLQLPSRPFYLDLSNMRKNIKPQGVVYFRVGSKKYPLAASFAVDQGEVVVISEPAIFFNMFISHEDNAVVAVRLLSGKGRTVLFDEFYHGLNVRGNAFWLLQRYPYNLIAFFFLLAFLLLAWRGACRLGKALVGRRNNRRSLHEYVEAMSELLSRADTRHYVLQEIYQNGIWHIARGMELNRKNPEPEYIEERLRRKDPLRADYFAQASAKMRILLAQERINSKDALQAVKEMNRCL